MRLRREYSYYLIQLYIPCMMLVVVSWVSFWLDKDAVPARVSLGVTTLLTMTTQASGINSKLPPVSYIKAVDVWIGSCLSFIFGALLEYALVNYCGRREFMSKEKNSNKLGTYQQDYYAPPHSQDFYNMPPSTQHLVNNNRPSLRLDHLPRFGVGVLTAPRPPKKSVAFRSKLKLTFAFSNLQLSKRVDIMSRFTFPSLFLCFLLFYYLIYVP